MHLHDILWEGVDGDNSGLRQDQWWALVEMNLQVPLKRNEFD